MKFLNTLITSFILLFLISINLNGQACELLGPLADDLVETTKDGDFQKHIADNSEGIKAYKELVDDGFTKSARRNVTNLKQRQIIDENALDIANQSNKRKGNFGEIGADLDLNSKGYTSLINRIDDIDAGGHNGLDGVYLKDGKYYIVEGKYSGSAAINGAVPPNLPRQMSDEWIATRSWEGVNLDQNIIDDLIQNKNYERILAKTAPDGTVTYSKVKADGYKINGPNGVWDPNNP